MNRQTRITGILDRGARSAARAVLAIIVSGCGAKTGLLEPDGHVASDASVVDGLDASTARDATDQTTMDGVDVNVPFDTSDETAQLIAASLDGLRWELPCESVINDSVCSTPIERRVSATLHGPPGEQYRATFRFRGVVELKTYGGGSNDGAFWQIGGTPNVDTINTYGLTISSPPQQYYLNRVTLDAFACFALDYDETLLLDTGATVTLDAASVDGHEVRNVDTMHQPIVVPGVRPAPAPFDGQFIQLDVVALERVR